MSKEQTVKAIALKHIKVSDLEPNPHNPRMLFDPDPMETLCENISNVGILVPLTVYEKAKAKGKYVILDGQRRWICAQKVGLTTVPANIVAEPSTFQNIVTMFQIHKLRSDWELMPTALKVKVLIEDMKESNDKKLAELTGMDEAVVTRCKKLLTFEDRYQDMMLDPNPDERWGADFFIELYAVRNDRIVNKFTWFKKVPFTDAMIKKKVAGGMKAVTDFRTIKQHISNASKANKVDELSKRFREFTHEPMLTVNHLEIEGVGVSAQVKRMAKDIVKLRQVISGLEVDQFFGEESLWEELESLAAVIKSKMKELGRRPK